MPRPGVRGLRRRERLGEVLLVELGIDVVALHPHAGRIDRVAVRGKAAVGASRCTGRSRGRPRRLPARRAAPRARTPPPSPASCRARRSRRRDTARSAPYFSARIASIAASVSLKYGGA